MRKLRIAPDILLPRAVEKKKTENNTLNNKISRKTEARRGSLLRLFVYPGFMTNVLDKKWEFCNVINQKKRVHQFEKILEFLLQREGKYGILCIISIV